MSKIPLYTQTTQDWHCHKNQPNKPYAVDLNVGTNEYVFGRVTPNNKFIVTTGLVKDPNPHGIKMVGGKKNKSKNKKGGNVMDSFKTDSLVYNENNYRNNELIYNAISKINKLNGLNSPCKNSMIDAQNNISGGSKRKMKGGKESEGATGMPLQFYNAKMPAKVNVKSSVSANDSATVNLAPYLKGGSRVSNGGSKKKMKGGKESEGATGMPVQFYGAKMPSKVSEKTSVQPNDSATVNLAPYSKVGGKKQVKKAPVKKPVTKKPVKKTPVKKPATKKTVTKKK